MTRVYITTILLFILFVVVFLSVKNYPLYALYNSVYDEPISVWQYIRQLIVLN